MADIAIYAMVLGYQKRCLWQVSSLDAQVPWNGNDVPGLHYVASVTRRDPHWAWNEKLVRAFGTSRKVEFVLDTWPAESEDYGRRGHIRTKNLKECPWDWACFVDADMVYHPQFWAQIGAKLSGFSGQPKVVAAPRMSMAFEDGYTLVDGYDYTADAPVPDPFKKTQEMKTWPSAHGRISGAGFFQLVHVPSVREYMKSKYGDVFYCAPTWNRDHNTFETTHITRSDRMFRMLCGGIVPVPDLLPQVHLNHYRKNDPECVAKGHH